MLSVKCNFTIIDDSYLIDCHKGRFSGDHSMKLKFIKVFTLKHPIGFMRCLERLRIQDNDLLGLGMMC